MKVFQPHLVHSILNEPWAISEDAAHSLAPLVANIFNPSLHFEAGEPILPSVISATPHAAINGEPSKGNSKNIKVITISGALTKRSQYCGPAGMDAMGQWIKEADNDRTIDGILLKIDSPGGTVNGTEELGNIIKNTSKPIVAFVDDLCASAAYWLASNADEIIANNSTAEVGSIGVLLSFMDVQPAYELQGVKFHTIVAPQSSEKVQWFEKLRQGNYEEYKNEVLKPLADKFINVVKANRGDINADKYFKGKLFFAQDVVGDLVDSIGSFETALSRVAELSDISNKKTAKTKVMKFKQFAKAAGVETFESVDGSISLSEEQAQAVESALETAETNAANNSNQLTEAQNSINQTASLLDAIDESVAAVKDVPGKIAAIIALLAKKPGASSATVDTDTDGGGNSGEESFHERFARLSKNVKH